MMTMANVAAKNGAVLAAEMPGLSWGLLGARVNEKSHLSLLQKLFGRNVDEMEEGACTKKYTCWTCGATYKVCESREFLTHIKVCCKK
jgi:hypothetical protein